MSTLNGVLIRQHGCNLLGNDIANALPLFLIQFDIAGNVSCKYIITTHHPLCAAIVLTHLPLTNGDFRRKYRPITGSHGPLMTTDNPLDHVILNAMDKIITTHHPLCAAIVLTHLPLTNGDFRRKYQPITGSQGPLMTTDNPLDHVILNAMDKILVVDKINLRIAKF